MQPQETHHRHDHQHGLNESTPLTGTVSSSRIAATNNDSIGAPLVHHMSLMKEEVPDVFIGGGDGKVHAGPYPILVDFRTFLQKHSSRKACIGLVAALLLLLFSVVHVFITTGHPKTTTIENSQEAMLDLGNGIEMWYRTWGNRKSGVPVLFVHGGPGNAVADYNNINSKFFDYTKFFVVESDQRGTGRSQPSVWDDWSNMKYYEDISINLMAADFEVLREELGIDKWLVFGGSWGSTLSMFYGEQYPERSLGLIIRGVFLNTKPEFDDVYTPKRFIASKNEKQIREFQYFFEVAEQEANDSGEAELDRYDSERIVKLYNRMIKRGDKMAMWIWYVYENNLMEEDPKKLLNFDEIDSKSFPEAAGVAFFESQLFLDGQFNNPYRILERVGNLKKDLPAPVHTWVCQGKRDQVCPPEYAQELVDALQEASIPTYPHFIKAPHQCTDPVMQVCLRETVDDFYEKYTSDKLGLTS